MCRRLRHPALEWCGIDTTPEALAAELAALAGNWGDFGGVTFGGGEPSLQAAELAPLLRTLRRNGIHTAFESNAATAAFPLLVSEADLVIADLKSGTAETFRACTGGDFGTVLANLARAAEEADALLLRIPFVPGCNDAPEERSAMAGILDTLNRSRRRAKGEPLAVEVLPFHHFGDPKYRALGKPCPMENVPPPSPETVAGFERELAGTGLQIERN